MYKKIEELFDVAGIRVEEYDIATDNSNDVNEILMRARLAIYRAKAAVRYDCSFNPSRASIK